MGATEIWASRRQGGYLLLELSPCLWLLGVICKGQTLSIPLFSQCFSGIGFLNLDTIDILGRIILYCMDLCNSIPGLYPLDVNSIS